MAANQKACSAQQQYDYDPQFSGLLSSAASSPTVTRTRRASTSPADGELLSEPMRRTILGDARATGLASNSVDLIVTSPPYWQKRDYGHQDQIGLEETPQQYVASILDCLREWRRVLRPHGSIFMNVGDTYLKKSLVGIPGRIESAAADDGFLIRNRIIWAKTSGMPDPVKNRLVNRHEYVIHLTLGPNYYYDLYRYAHEFGNGSNPGDVWQIQAERSNNRAHLAPFPTELVRRSITLAAPPRVCGTCGQPSKRIVERTSQLDPTRPQAARAMQLASEAGLTSDHIAAIQATGVSDAGKATKFQNGTGRNCSEVQQLAREAKNVLGGYFREFTFAKKVTTGWTDCGHDNFRRGVILDPFVGTGTTLDVAREMGFDSVGVDLVDYS